jgi:hypothetical protein
MNSRSLVVVALLATGAQEQKCDKPKGNPTPTPTPSPVAKVTPTPTPVARVLTGCSIAGGASGVGCGLLTSFGDPVSDFQMNAEYQYQASYWYGVPAVAYVLNDCNAPNAYAPSSERVILYGVNLFRGLKSTGADAGIIGVLAHEWAHRLQFENGWTTNPVKRMELEADAFAGFYFGLAKSWAWGQTASFFQTVASMGDNAFNDPQHHGTSAERLAAARLGFDLGAYSLLNRRPYSWFELHAYFSGQIRALSGAPFVPGVDLTSPIRMDISEVQAIAQGKSHGSEKILPQVDEAVRRTLFPR